MVPFVSDGSHFSRTRLVFYRFIVTSYHNSPIFRHVTSRHFSSGCISLHLASRISRHIYIDNLSVFTSVQLFHSTLLESDRAARGRSLFEKKKALGYPVQNSRAKEHLTCKCLFCALSILSKVLNVHRTRIPARCDETKQF